MSVDVYIQSGISIQVTAQSLFQAPASTISGVTIAATPQSSPTYVIGNPPVLAGSGQGASESWVDSIYYPRSNPSGYATGVDASLFVRHSQSGVLLARGETGLFLTTGQVIKFSVELNSGYESQFINYPTILGTRPRAVSCEFENNIDYFIYSHVLTGVNTSGFWISFSDALSDSGYWLYATLNT